jgi:hypothetical protein
MWCSIAYLNASNYSNAAWPNWRPASGAERTCGLEPFRGHFLGKGLRLHTDDESTGAGSHGADRAETPPG